MAKKDLTPMEKAQAHLDKMNKLKAESKKAKAESKK